MSGIPESVLDNLAYEIEKLRGDYLLIEDFVTEYSDKLTEAPHLCPEIRKDIVETFEAVENKHRMFKSNTLKLLDEPRNSTVTKTLAAANPPAPAAKASVSAPTAPVRKPLPLPKRQI